MNDKRRKLMERCREGLRRENRPWIMYRKSGKFAALPLATYLAAGLDEKGATRLYVVTRNGKGQMI